MAPIKLYKGQKICLSSLIKDLVTNENTTINTYEQSNNQEDTDGRKEEKEN